MKIKNPVATSSIIPGVFFALIIVGVLTFSNVSAANLKTGLIGGRILTTRTSPVICNAQYGVVTVAPARGSDTKPFTILSTDKTVTEGGQILGLYDKQVDTQTCYIQAGPYRIPVPTYKIKAGRFNTSKY
jgi:hypothetical protein